MPENKTCCEKIKSFSIEKTCKSNNLLKNLCEVVESHPDNNAKNIGMSIIYLLGGNYSKALEYLNSLVKAHPEIELLHRRIAEVYISQNDFETAITYLENALKIDKENLTVKIWLSLSYFVVGDEKKANNFLRSLKEEIFLFNVTSSDNL